MNFFLCCNFAIELFTCGVKLLELLCLSDLLYHSNMDLFVYLTVVWLQ